MFKSKVSCWFCSEESYVYFYKKNSWSCESCGQYNGFNKVGYFLPNNKNTIKIMDILLFSITGWRL